MKTDHVDVIMQVADSLLRLPKDMERLELNRQMFSHVNSKYSNDFNLSVLNEIDDNGIACLVSLGGDVSVKFDHLNKYITNKYLDSNIFTIKENELLMFPTHIPYTVIGDNAYFLIFKVAEKVEIGTGESNYLIEITFSDTYRINIKANSEDEAKDLAMKTNMSYWIHEWPEDPELNMIQGTRMSKWGRKMLKAYKIN